MLMLISISGCSKNETNPILEVEEEILEEDDEEIVLENQYVLPNIDLNHWKVTLPIGNPTEVLPPEILDYAKNETLKPFMYNDSINGALVFYTYPGASTANSSYSRTELRELLNPEDSGKTNWTFAQGGIMKGTLSMDDISKDSDGDYHRAIIMQIHGRLTDEQRDLIGEDDNNAPPMLKIYWTNGYVRVKTKVLKDLNASSTEILYTDAWGDDEGYTFDEFVGFNKFALEVKVSEGKMEVILNENESVVYDDIHVEKWGVFENYFKAGNYLVSLDNDSYSKVKYYELEITH
ncbi:MAG: polysaccharide lyase family 7 protein [Lutibacter sp.]|uniref:polysaccharide lyase family 7 protein n=1 Tax=Lutibacter sp. TaxID=1925666 RepID=UPI001833393C|nr:polysaccharide lyase family 7 protein [Lutibacter sp.]MBT8316053.1 polysaccharide lyase family 7 protein [Lutibacter sp.]NNJ56913.1 polysaccharide lyase family 7 protein [Lutibacter sp.]